MDSVGTVPITAAHAIHSATDPPNSVHHFALLILIAQYRYPAGPSTPQVRNGTSTQRHCAIFHPALLAGAVGTEADGVPEPTGANHPGAVEAGGKASHRGPDAARATGGGVGIRGGIGAGGGVWFGFGAAVLARNAVTKLLQSG